MDFRTKEVTGGKEINPVERTVILLVWGYL